MNLEPGLKIGNRYEILEKLGEGGMGVVWKASDCRLGDVVVVKVPQLVSDTNILRRFAREAQAMRKHSLECPNILEINDIGQIGDFPYYVMQYLAGGSLREYKQNRDQSGELVWEPESFEWLPQIAAALDYLHSQETVHRDVKPDNILFSENGIPFLVDFGVAKSNAETQSVITETGKVVGTWAYMAPELLDDKPFTPKADQYALAVTLYETITGERPFGGTTPVAIVKSIMRGHRGLTELSSTVPPNASAAVDSSLALNPDDRFDTCQDFATAFLDGLKPESFDKSKNVDSSGPPAPPVSGVATYASVDVPDKKPIFPPHKPSKNNTAHSASVKRTSAPAKYWIGSLLAVLVVGAGVWLFTRPSPKTGPPTVVVTPTVNGETKTGTLKTAA